MQKSRWKDKEIYLIHSANSNMKSLTDNFEKKEIFKISFSGSVL
jgi:hypothetical protein